MNHTSVEIVGILISVIGAIVACFTWLFKNVLKPGYVIINSHQEVATTIQWIKKELSTNGGSSIKDIINRIENRQIVVDHRSKAIFYDYETPLFEVDATGQLMWANDNFHDLSNGKENLKGLDWISLIDEPYREQLLNEFNSCVTNNRNLRLETVCMDGKTVEIHGIPYREKNVNHGFLIYFNKGE